MMFVVDWRITGYWCDQFSWKLQSCIKNHHHCGIFLFFSIASTLCSLWTLRQFWYITWMSATNYQKTNISSIKNHLLGHLTISTWKFEPVILHKGIYSRMYNIVNLYCKVLNFHIFILLECNRINTKQENIFFQL